MGWFFGFKLHIIINDKGEILSFMITPANTDDPLKNPSFVEKASGKICGDKGYFDNRLFVFLFLDGVQKITRIKSHILCRTHIKLEQTMQDEAILKIFFIAIS